MTAMHAAVSVSEKDFRALRQPQLRVMRDEFHRRVFHGNVFGLELDLRDRRHDIRFQADNLKTVRSDPRAAAQGDGKRERVHPVATQACRLVRLLPEMRLPSKATVPAA